MPRTPAKKKSAAPTPVEAVEHKDRRVNIPTGQQAHLVDADESTALSLRYPRDPSLDPQLVWKGKDAQDGEDLVVPAVPIYIQEKIEPRALIENLRDTAASAQDEPELKLFADYDGFESLDALEKLDFYQHEDGKWQNRMILGDSMVVMTSLAEKEHLRGKVQTIYIDPPYGIKFGSNWQVSTRRREVSDGKVADATREPEVVKAFRDTWELGIHSYLSYLRDRLVVARELLTETGSCFVQIGDENVHRVRAVMDEVFGDANFVTMITFKTTSSATGDYLGGVADHVLWFAKSRETMKYRQLFTPKTPDGEGGTAYTWVEDLDGTRRRRADGDPPDLRKLRMDNLTSQSQGRQKGEGAASWFEVELDSRMFTPTMQSRWKTNEDGMANLKAARRIYAVGNTLSYVRYLDDFPAFPISNLWSDTTTAGFAADKIYVVQTNPKIMERCVLMTTDPGDLVLDPTCGSGATARVAEQWGRRWITIDTSRVALALARTRLMAARYPYYLLADSREGGAKEEELTHQLVTGPFTNDIKRGFVYKRVPHVTLKSIAQNPDIQDGMSRAEIETAIAAHAESELLVDQPYVDNKRVRVTGAFTVESLSPHRLLEDDESDTKPAPSLDVVQFETLILDNLRKAGVQNGAKDERLVFDRLEPKAGEWLQAEGEYREADGSTRRVVVSIGPEYGTVGAEQVALAAQESAHGTPADVLLVTGFAFDPQAWAKAKEINPDVAERSIGRLRVLLVRANSDLSMGDELLKKTGAGNLFTVFGEPDIDIRTDAEGRLVVELGGLDVYDPTTGEVRSSSTDDVAAWFLDTNYDGTSFFVRHAYFTGGQKPYESLAKALRADIDADAWSTLYSTVSRPFAAPATGRVAVKVINHYGDEILQVYDVAG